MIEHLSPITPDASRGARTVARCHQRLAAERRRLEARRRPRHPRTAALERYLAAGLCAVYLLAMAGELMAVAAMR